MLKKLATWVFVLGAAVSGAALWELSSSSWGKTERHTILEKEYRVIGPQGSGTETPRFKLQPVEGDQRLPLEVPRNVFDEAAEGDQLTIRTQTIPVAGVDLLHYSVQHAGKMLKEWDEGWPFFGFVLGVAAFAGGGLVLGLFLFVGALFRFRAPSE